MLRPRPKGGPEETAKFEQLYHRYKGLLYYVARNILQDPHEAEEVVQDAFLAVLETLDKVGEADSPRTKSYLVTITEHKALNLLQRKQRHPQEELPSTLADPALLEAAADDALARCILRLRPRYREIILLRYEQGFTPREAAKLLGLSLAGAYKLEQRAKGKLKTLCQQEGIDL